MRTLPAPFPASPRPACPGPAHAAAPATEPDAAQALSQPARAAIRPKDMASVLHGEILLHWNRGSQLPCDLDLARIFNVSVATMRSALERLERQGVVHRDAQARTTVAAPATAPAAADAPSGPVRPSGRQRKVWIVARS